MIRVKGRFHRDFCYPALFLGIRRPPNGTPAGFSIFLRPAALHDGGLPLGRKCFSTPAAEAPCSSIAAASLIRAAGPLPGKAGNCKFPPWSRARAHMVIQLDAAFNSIDRFEHSY